MSPSYIIIRHKVVILAKWSRFILQLMVEWNHPIHRLTSQAGQDPMRVEAKVVEKNEAVLRKLDEMSYFSPTAINTYITCKLKYYFKYIAGINELDEVDVDDVDNRMFGNIFHTAAQLCMKSYYQEMSSLLRT